MLNVRCSTELSVCVVDSDIMSGAAVNMTGRDNKHLKRLGNYNSRETFQALSGLLRKLLFSGM